MATLVLASNAPAPTSSRHLGGIDYLAAHRGPTHGPLGVVGLGLLTAGLVAAWARWRGHDPDTGASGVTWGSVARWWGLAMVGILGHLLIDLPTAYGTRVFSPFSGTWFAFDCSDHDGIVDSRHRRASPQGDRPGARVGGDRLLMA